MLLNVPCLELQRGSNHKSKQQQVFGFESERIPHTVLTIIKKKYRMRSHNNNNNTTTTTKINKSPLSPISYTQHNTYQVVDNVL